MGKINLRKGFCLSDHLFHCKLPRGSYLLMCWAFNSLGIACGIMLKNNDMTRFTAKQFGSFHAFILIMYS